MASPLASDLSAVGHWMYLDDIGRDPEHSIASMLKMALSRCWIFQETAFGSLDDMVGGFFGDEPQSTRGRRCMHSDLHVLGS